jgi:hypothetical protein
MTFSLHSPAFKNGGAIPDKYARDGENRSPPLRWTDPPVEAKSFMLVVEDPDAPSGLFHHWAVHDLDPKQTELHEGAGNGETGTARQGVNDFGDVGYDGPQPPPGDGVHHYHFRLAALDVAHLDLPDGADAASIAEKASAHVVGETEIVGTYQG